LWFSKKIQKKIGIWQETNFNLSFYFIGCSNYYNGCKASSPLLQKAKLRATKIILPSKTTVGKLGMLICYDLRFPEMSRIRERF